MPSTFRIDKFVVPPAHQGEFLAAVAVTHEVLRAQPGFRRDLILRQCGGPGRFNLLTLVEWDAGIEIAGVAAAVRRRHAEIGLDPQSRLRDWGVEADLGLYDAG
jgi:hypothetical protein